MNAGIIVSTNYKTSGCETEKADLIPVLWKC